MSFTHYRLCACGNNSWYPLIRKLCESQCWCKDFGEGNNFFLCWNQTTFPCSLSLWFTDYTTYTGLAHLVRSTNHQVLHVIFSILFVLILSDPNNFLCTIFSNTCSVCSFLIVKDRFTSIQSHGQNCMYDCFK